MADEPPFRIDSRPERRFPGAGGLEYEGGTVFVLEPDPGGGAVDDGRLGDLVEAVLEGDSYRFGDFLELPMPVFLVRDDDRGDVFRVSIRDGTVRLHVLPETQSDGLRAFYRRLRAEGAVDWRVSRRPDA